MGKREDWKHSATAFWPSSSIMVLELKVPHGSDIRDILQYMACFPELCTQLLYIGIYWDNHHHLMHSVKSNRPHSLEQPALAVLAIISALRHCLMGESHFSTQPMAVYGFVLLMSGVAYYFWPIAWPLFMEKTPPLPRRLEKISGHRFCCDVYYRYWPEFHPPLVLALPVMHWLPPSGSYQTGGSKKDCPWSVKRIRPSQNLTSEYAYTVCRKNNYGNMPNTFHQNATNLFLITLVDQTVYYVLDCSPFQGLSESVGVL